MYDQDSPSRKLITEIMETYFLVNVVHNDFQAADAIFKGFFETSNISNGVTNGIQGEKLTNGMKDLVDVAHGLSKEISAISVA